MTDLRIGVLRLFVEAARFGHRRYRPEGRIYRVTVPPFDPFDGHGPEIRFVVVVERPQGTDFPRAKGFVWLALAERYAARANRNNRRPRLHARATVPA